MFYAHFVLSKRGPLAKIWLAAHWDKKLTKAHVFETNIDSSVEEIIKPKVKMALRTSGHLLLGVVRIYSRKAKYLLADCNEAFVKIKMAFRPGVVDLPEENREAAVATITLPETFHDFDTTMADLNDIDVQAHQFSVNQSRPEEITMREDLGNITLIGDDGFGDMGFDDGEMPRDPTIDDSLYKSPDSSSILLHNRTDKDHGAADKSMELDFQAPAKEDDFGEALGEPLYADDDPGADDDSDDDNDFGGGVDHELFDTNFMDHGGLFEEPVPEPEEPMPPEIEPPKNDDKEKDAEAEDTTMATEQTTVLPDQTTLVQNEAEAFALEPLDVTSIGTERKAKRKRKLIVDEQKGIPSETMKMQLSDTSDIVTTLDLAPPTKKLMHWKETGGVEKLFALPGRAIISRRINKLFVRNLITRPTDDRDEDEEEQEQLELAPEVTREEEQPAPSTSDQLPIPDMPEEIPPIEEPSRVEEAAPPTPAPAEVSRRSTRRSEVTLPPETPKPVEQQQPSPDQEDNDDIFMDNLEAVQEQTAAEAGKKEEVEDQRWSKRTHQMMHTVTRALAHADTASFKELVQRNNRKQVASKFYTFLVLKKQQALELQQQEPYGDIWISPGPRFNEVY